MMNHASPRQGILFRFKPFGFCSSVVVAVSSDANGRVDSLVGYAYRFAPMTYSIYMWHGTVILILMNALGDKIFHLSTIPMIALLVVSVALTSVISILSLNLFEHPVRVYLNNISDRILGGT